MRPLKILLVIILCFSCQDNRVKRPEKPDNLLSEEKMVAIIYDMSITSAAKGINKKRLEKEGIQPDAYVYRIHGIDSTQFSESNNYYAYDLEAYKRIYKQVQSRLEKEKVIYDSISLKERADEARKDSINKVNRNKKNAPKAGAQIPEFVAPGDKSKADTLKNKKSLPKKTGLPNATPNLLKKRDSSQISTRQ